jgi:hypothetical protein
LFGGGSVTAVVMPTYLRIRWRYMQLAVDSEFRYLCHQIVAQGRTEEEWSEIESDDTFQSDNYAGGFDATEQAFCFSYYTPEGEEHWIQLTLGGVEAVAAGELRSIAAHPART